MCGIVGLGALERLPESTGARLDAAARRLHHRGPDGGGRHVHGQVGLAHRRLSIIDTSDDGAQPMVSACGRYAIAYNGETYNFREIARELGLANLRSRSDTEVVLEAFALEGPKAIARFNGIFAFAIHDMQANCLWLGRDRLGIKPLYLARQGDQLAFGSEIKALQSLFPDLRRINLAALPEWSYYGTTIGAGTLFSGVEQLLPGHYARIDLTDLSREDSCYWRPDPAACVADPARPLADQTRDLLEQAVKRQLIADVPVGVFLSKLASYSVAFDYAADSNELPKARHVAKTFGTDHHELTIAGSDMADLVETLVTCHDQPFSDAANLPLYLMCQKINADLKVVLQGDGGDELFGGYSRYRTLSRLGRTRAMATLGGLVNGLTPRNAAHHRRQRYIDALKARPLSRLMALLLTVEHERHTPLAIFAPDLRRAFQGIDPFARYGHCAAPFADLPPADQMFMVDSQIILADVFLPKVDRATMGASVEARVPFLDNDLLAFSQSLTAEQKVPGGVQKHLLKEALRGIVPDDILFGPKSGFGVPFSFWLKGALKPLFMDTLDSFMTRQPGILDKAHLMALYKRHEDGTRDEGFLLWKVLNLMLWSNAYEVDWSGSAP